MVSFPSFKLCFKNFSNMKLINESSNNRWLYFIRENKQKNITALVFEYNRIEFDFFENKYLKMKKKISIPHFSPHFHTYHRKSIYIIADITCVFSNLISYAISLFLIFVLFRTIGSLWPRSYHGRCIIRGKVTSLSLSLKLNFRNWNGKWTIRISNELPRKTLYFFFFFWKILYLSRRTTFADSSSFPSRLYGAGSGNFYAWIRCWSAIQLRDNRGTSNEFQ